MTETLTAALNSAIRARFDLQNQLDDLERDNAQLRRRIRELERLLDGYKRGNYGAFGQAPDRELWPHQGR